MLDGFLDGCFHQEHIRREFVGSFPYGRMYVGKSLYICWSRNTNKRCWSGILDINYWSGNSRRQMMTMNFRWISDGFSHRQTSHIYMSVWNLSERSENLTTGLFFWRFLRLELHVFCSDVFWVIFSVFPSQASNNTYWVVEVEYCSSCWSE